MDRSDLERRLIPYEERRVSLASIDLDGRQLLQNREEYEPEPATIEDYTAAWLRGDPFPPVILWEDSSDHYLPVDGYTRCRSARRAGEEEIDALVVKCDRHTAELGAREANARHGRRASREWLLNSAVQMADEGMTVREASERTNIAPDAITERRAIMRASRRATELKVTRSDKLSEKVLEKLAAVDMDEPFRALAQLAVDGNLKPTKVADLGRDVRKARSEADALAVIEAARSELGVIVADEATERLALGFKRFVGQVVKLRSVDVTDVVKSAHLSGRGREEVEDVATRLREITASYEAAAADIYG